MAEAPRKRKRRRWPIALAIIAVLVLIGALALRHYTRPETLTALLIGNARSQLGVELALSEPGRFGFMPNLHLILPRPALRETPQSVAFLSADSADVVVPWSTLWSGRYDIEGIELIKPQLDLDALDAWLRKQPASAPRPDVRFSLRAKGATLISGGKPIATGVDLDFRSTGDVAGWLAGRSESSTMLLPPLAGTIDAPAVEVGGTRLEGVHIESREDDGAEIGKPAR